jgi:hypothetical protein
MDTQCVKCGLSRRGKFLFLKAAHPQRDGRSNEQITQQAERPTPPTTVRTGQTVLYIPRVEVPCVVASENGNNQHFTQKVNQSYCHEHQPLGLGGCLGGMALAHRVLYLVALLPLPLFRFVVLV